MTSDPGEFLAVELAAHWRAILRSQPHQLRLPELVRRQLPLMVKALGRREIAVPAKVQDLEDVFRPKDLPEPFVVGHWTLHADLDLDRQWACGMVAVSSEVIQKSYIERNRPNLFDEPFAWAQSGVHEAVQDNFRLPSHWLAKVRNIKGNNAFWYDAALGAHIAYCIRASFPRANPTDAELESNYNDWAKTFGITQDWGESKRLAAKTAKLHITTPGHVIPLSIITRRAKGLGIDEALWQFLSDPKRGFGLSKHQAAELIGVPYSTLSSKQAHRKSGRPRTGRIRPSQSPGQTPKDRPVQGQGDIEP